MIASITFGTALFITLLAACFADQIGRLPYTIKPATLSIDVPSVAMISAAFKAARAEHVATLLAAVHAAERAAEQAVQVALPDLTYLAVELPEIFSADTRRTLMQDRFDTALAAAYAA